ncbi:MAG: dihydropteroate synthase, partial [Cyanobacteria bacterium K_Offshore_0m_m2_072]|nr:dihydropteroate synthase [Cyanobacteria bacterium K_Offshore_0m_m2_072]
MIPPGPLVMGVLNLTPDSFSDGGRLGSTKAVLRQ